MINIKKTLALAILLPSVTVSLNAYSHGGSTDNNESTTVTSSMMPLPIMLGFNGNLSWGYHLSTSDHSAHISTGHSGTDNVAADHGSMDHGSMDHGNMDHGDMDHGDMDHGNMDHGNMDHGDMDHGDMDHGDMDHGDMNNADMDTNSWMYSVMPMLSLSGDYYSRIINIDSVNTSSSSFDIGIDTKSSKYVSIENKIISAGAGAMVMAMPMNFAIPLFGLRASMMPFKGGHVFRLKHIENKKDANFVKSMRVPFELKDLDAWSINDKMNYTSVGGVMFGAGVGMSIYIQAMQTYMAQGEFAVSVTKISNTEVIASIKNIKSKMFAQKLGNVLVELSNMKHTALDNGYSFIFDLSNKEASDAYRRFITGNVQAVQQAHASKIGGIEFVNSSKGKMTGKMRGFNFGIPFLFNSARSTSNMVTHTESINGFSGIESKSMMTMYKKSVDTNGILSKHKNSGIVFMGSTNINNKTGELLGFGGSFKWYFQKEGVSNYFFNREIRKLVNTFGVDNAKKIGIPTFKNMGFVRAEMDVLFKNSEVKTLLNNVNKTSLSLLTANMHSKVNNFFKSAKNTKSFCGLKAKLLLCKRKVYSQSLNKIKTVHKLVNKMNSALKMKSYPLFADKFGQLGKIILTNRFIFTEVMKMSGKTDNFATFKAQGSRVNKTVINL